MVGSLPFLLSRPKQWERNVKNGCCSAILIQCDKIVDRNYMHRHWIKVAIHLSEIIIGFYTLIPDKWIYNNAIQDTNLNPHVSFCCLCNLGFWKYNKVSSSILAWDVSNSFCMNKKYLAMAFNNLSRWIVLLIRNNWILPLKSVYEWSIGQSDLKKKYMHVFLKWNGQRGWLLNEVV